MRALPLGMLIMLAACNGGKDDPPPPETGGTGTQATTPTGVTGTTGMVETGDTELPPPPPIDCSAYSFGNDPNIQVYNCDLLDVCDPFSDPQFSLACCACDPANCVVDAEELAACPQGTNTITNTEVVTITVEVPPNVQNCMTCHNGSSQNDYLGSGITNPHPFGNAALLKCTDCHGGDPTPGLSKLDAHVGPPGRLLRENMDANYGDFEAYFNYLTKAGLDNPNLFPSPYVSPVNGNTYTMDDYIQFMNPGDMRIVTQSKSCGTCHSAETTGLSRDPIASNIGFFSATMFSVGIENPVPAYAELYGKTAGSYSAREITDPNWISGDPNNVVGSTGHSIEFPEYAQYGNSGFYDSFILQNGIYFNDDTFNQYLIAADNVLPGKYLNNVITGSPLDHAIKEVVTAQCADCHAGDAGANNRYADFRSSGCSACHMEYSMDGISRTADQNVNKREPFNPDQIVAPERPHAKDHMIRNVFKQVLVNDYPNIVQGQSDYVCVGCHQGSNRTVLQYWGIRLDQNELLENQFQYPANPPNLDHVTTEFDQRLYPNVPNVNGQIAQTFNGRVFTQYILEEDYDADNADDTPPDAHYEAGMGCIDCHGSRDLHNMHWDEATSSNVPGQLVSRESQTVGIACESCHGTLDDPPEYDDCTTYQGQPAQCAIDRYGGPLRNVTRNPGNGSWTLRSKITDNNHYIPLVVDVTKNTGATLANGTTVFSPEAAYAHGRTGDGVGQGPNQSNFLVNPNFTHLNIMDCNSCHVAVQNACMGCHLQTILDGRPDQYFFSNQTGERIAVNTNAQFVYQSTVLFNIGVGTRGKITNMMPGMKTFFEYFDNPDDNNTGNGSGVFAFTDRRGNGNNVTPPRGAFGSLSHNKISAHSIRGQFEANKYEGVQSCQTCHLNQGMVDDAAVYAEYIEYFQRYQDRDYAFITTEARADLNDVTQYEYVRTVGVGENSQNQNNSPFFVHQTVGLGSSLFLFDANGCPANPFDANDQLFPCNNQAPADIFDPDNIVYDLDRIVEYTGVSNSSTSHPFVETPVVQRVGSLTPDLSGPLGTLTISRLADPNVTTLILDSWTDTNGAPQGNANQFCLGCQ